MKRRLLFATGGAGLLPAPFLAAQGLPQRPLRLVVAFPPGGPTDIAARLLAEHMARDLGQPVVVENRGGANGNIAAEHVARAEPDGLTLLYNTSSIAISQALYRNLPYNLSSDLAPVALTVAGPALLAVTPALPVQSAADFAAWLRRESGRASYSSGGIGNISHLLSFMVTRHLGVEAIHVPYRGTAPALADAAAGRVHFTTDALLTALPLARDGRLRAIAVSSDRRSPMLPEIPTMAEAGLLPAGLDMGIWQGIMAPSRTPAAAITRLNAAVNTALADTTVQERLGALGAWATGGTAEEYADRLRREVALWARVVAESGARAE